jgi:ferritin-like metal-binding protein YciE
MVNYPSEQNRGEFVPAANNVRLMQWLRDARAIEKQAKKMLERVARHIEACPEIKARAETLIREVSAQASAMQEYVGQQGGKPGVVSQTPASPSEEQILSGAFVGSETVKRAMTEISSYNILIAAAESTGDSETREVCDTIRRQEEAMVQWLRNFLGAATEAQVVRELAASKRRHSLRKNGGGAQGTH